MARIVRFPLVWLALPLLTLPIACAGAANGDDGNDDVSETDTTAATESEGESEDSDETSVEPESTESETGEPLLPELPLCGTEPPPGAVLAPDLPTYSGPGSCPVLTTDGTVIVMETDHGPREFLLVAPSDLQDDEVLPVIFMYHWLGGDAVDFRDRAEAQIAADYYRFIAIIPEGRTSEQGVPFRWPFSIADEPMSFEEEFEFHDDLLACVAEQFSVDKECVSAMGVSAGAMFSAQLAGRHGDHLASFISLSGGVGGDLIQPWTEAANHMPALVLWGGPDDFCLGVDFDTGSNNLEADLETNGHFVMECIHNCTHATPPFSPSDPSLPTYAVTWEFFLDHPYWLEDGVSPYLDYPTGSLPPAWPEWCAIGAGNAMIRVGECGGSEC